jgi:hypothetical protein
MSLTKHIKETSTTSSEEPWKVVKHYVLEERTKSPATLEFIAATLFNLIDIEPLLNSMGMPDYVKKHITFDSVALPRTVPKIESVVKVGVAVSRGPNNSVAVVVAYRFDTTDVSTFSTFLEFR